MKKLLHSFKSQSLGMILIFIGMNVQAQNICVSGNTVSPAATQNICLGSSSSPLTTTVTTNGTGSNGNITYNWYSNTINSTTGGTLVQTLSATTSTTSNTFSPPASSTGSLWYYSVVTNDGGSCAGTSVTSSTVQVNVNPLPQIFNVSGGGARCSNSPGIGVYISNSEVGVNYQLMRDGLPVGSVRSGTGHSLSYLVASAGTYTLQAINVSGSCTATMSGSAIVTINAAPTASYTKTDVSCVGGDATITVTGSGGTPAYLYNIDGGSFSTSNNFSGLSSGTHAVIVRDANTCSVTTNVAIQNASPVSVNITSVNPGDCSGNTGSITATMSGGVDDGITPIEFKLDGDVTRPYQTSNVFGGLSKGNYTITIKDSKGCTGVSSTVSLTQVAGTTPTVFDVTGGGTRCSNGSGIAIQLSGSETGVSYQLSTNGLPIGTSLSGTGNPLSFVVSDSGTYTIVATNTTAGCTNLMNGNATIVVNPSPATFNVSGGGLRCSNSAGVGVFLSNSETGVNYQLMRDGVAVGSIRSGTGHSLSYLVTTAGTYTLQAISVLGSCTTTMTGSATVAAGINPALTPTYTKYYASSCVGGDGTITVTGNGGTPGYLYNIDNGPFSSNNQFTGLAAGDHKIVVKDANACTFTYVGITVLTAPIMSVTASTIPVGSCTGNDGSITGLYYGGVVDGITPLQYKLDGDAARPYQTNNTFSGLVAGNYTVSIKDSKGCVEVSTPITLTTADTLAFMSTSYNTNVSSCGNGADARISVGVTGGIAPYHYLLNGTEQGQSKVPFFGFQDLGVGSYTVTVSDLHGCSISKDFTISQASAPIASVVYSGNETCINANNGYISLSPTNIGGIPPQYSYSKDGGTTYQSSYSFTNLAPGTYSMMVKDSKGCTSSPVSVTINAGTASCTAPRMYDNMSSERRSSTIEKSNVPKPLINSLLSVQAYPNPSSSQFTLDVAGNNKEKVSIIVTDLLGRMHQQIQGSANQTFKLGSKLKPGVYIVQVSQGDKVQTVRIVKE